MEILNQIGVNTPMVADNNESQITSSHDSLVLFEKPEPSIQKHQDIDNILQQVETVMEQDNESPSKKFVQIIDLYKKAVQMASKEDCNKELLYNLLCKYARALSDAGLYQDAEMVYFRQLSIAEELYGAEHEKTASLFNNIGSICKDRGEYNKALDYYYKALKIDEKILGIGHLSSAMDYNNIGLVYDSLGDY